MIEKRLVTRFLDMFIQFGLILALVPFCFTVFSPFINMILWALIPVVALYPLHQYFAGLLVGKQGLASVVLVLLGILLIVTPTVLMTTLSAESASVMIDKTDSQSFAIPPPSSCIVTLPIIGGRPSALWTRVSVDFLGLLSNYRSQIGDIAKQFLNILVSMGGGLVGFTIPFIASGIVTARGATGAISAQRIAIRITDESKDMILTRLRISTIRAVAQGVIGVALIQALLVGAIMLIVSVPAVGTFFILALILGIAQVPMTLATASAIVLVQSLGTHNIGMDIFYVILVIAAGMADNVLKPLPLGHRVGAPTPAVLPGALGEMVSNGIPGMFLGAALLVIDYWISVTWVNEGQPALSQDR